jgi:pimeloyl-ACP methyl ester carboxylesterase
MTSSHEIQVDGHKLVALSCNPDTPGPPIILLHGITASIYFWTPDQISIFAERGPCYVLSLPGHYPAVFPPDFQKESLTAENIAHVLTAAIQRLVGNQPVLLVGHSTGGFAALDIAAHAPELARGIISISGFAQGRWIGALGFNQWLVRCGSLGKLLFKLGYKLNRSTRIGHWFSWRVYASDSGRLYAYPHFETVFSSVYAYFKKLDLEAMAQYFAVMPDIDISPLLSNITAPVLALTGDGDPTVPPAQAHLIAAKVPQADLAVIQGVGHMPFLEHHVEYQRVLREWLQRQLG